MSNTPTPEELANLQALADTVDTDNGQHLTGEDGQPLPPAEPVKDFAGEARAAVDTFAALAVGYAPAAGDLWDDAAKSRIAAALGPVMEKYGFSLGALPPELTLIIVAGPVLYQTSKIIAAQMADQKAKDKPAPKVQSTEPAATLGQAEAAATPEVARHPQAALYK
jgi:hypothetical protein